MQKLDFHPLSQKRWSDLERLFGERGASGGCWCMWWKLRRSEYERKKGTQNKKAFKNLVRADKLRGFWRTSMESRLGGARLNLAKYIRCSQIPGSSRGWMINRFGPSFVFSSIDPFAAKGLLLSC